MYGTRENCLVPETRTSRFSNSPLVSKLRFDLEDPCRDQNRCSFLDSVHSLLSDVFFYRDVSRKIASFSSNRYDQELGFLAKIGPARQPFDFVSIDTVGGFHGNPNAKYMHLAVDHLTRHAWAHFSESTNADDIVELIEKIQKDGNPRRILTDNHKCLLNQKVTKFANKHKITLVLVPPDSASANGMIERLNQTITNKLRCAYNENLQEFTWDFYCERVIKMYNETPHSVTRFKPIFLLKGGEMPTAAIQNPFPNRERALLQAYLRSMRKNAKNAFYYNKNRKNYDIQIGD